MKLKCLLGDLFSSILNDFASNATTMPMISSISKTKEKNAGSIITGTWDNVNSSFVLVLLTIIGALALNNRCYGRDKEVWIDDCILNQILLLILLSLLFNLESRVLPSSISTTGTTGGSASETDTFVQTSTSNSLTNTSVSNEVATIASSEPVVVETVVI